MKKTILLVILVVAVITAGVAALLLRKVQVAVERTTTPVEVAAPDLFPQDTLLFAAAHRMDESWSAVESWWKQVEPTAAWFVAKGQWDRTRERGNLPAGLKSAVEDFEKAMDAAEARLGYRPNTKQFFETYGRYTAFGLLPAADKGRPRMLLVVKLPGDAAMEVLRQKLGGAAKRHDPPDLHGYPVFVESGGAIGNVLYGVGGGYLFVADDAATLGGALGRLAAKAAGGATGATANAPGPSLAQDPAFKRTVPAKWEEVGLALFVRKNQQFARWHERLALLDQYLAHAFVLAPGEESIALCAVRIPGGPDFRMQASFAAGTGDRPWADLLPEGMSRAMTSAPPGTPASREALLAGVEAFRSKKIWKEADALVRDGPRLRLLLGEAIGPRAVPDDEVLRRLPADADLFASTINGLMERAVLAPTASLCMGQRTKDANGVSVETVLGMRCGPLETFLVAAGLDLLVEKQGEWFHDGPPPFERVADAGFLAWRFRLTRLLDTPGGLPREIGPALDIYRGSDPSLVVSGGVLWFTMGDAMFEDMRGLAAGRGKSLSADPLYGEALAAVPPGASTIDYVRPGEVMRGMVAVTGGQIAKAAESTAGPEVGDIFKGVLAAFEEVVRWEGSVRAIVTAGYPDPARPEESVVLLDTAKESTVPRLALDPAALAAPGLLPGGTCLLVEGRIDLRPATEAFIAAFLKGLPGGRTRWDELRRDVPMERKDLEDRLDALLVDMKGEAGLAVIAPSVESVDTLKGTQDLIDRIPAFVSFASYAHPDVAFGTASDLLALVAEATREQESFAARRKRFDRGVGSVPMEITCERIEVSGRPVTVLQVAWPERPRGKLLTAGIAVVRRGDLLLYCSSLPVAMSIAGAEPGDAGTFAERIGRELPAGTLPAESAGLWVARTDGFADCLALYTRPMAPSLAGLSLQGAEEPTEERMRAHQEGWKQVALLFDDLLRSGSWTVGSTVREKDRLRTTTRRLKGK